MKYDTYVPGLSKKLSQLIIDSGMEVSEVAKKSHIGKTLLYLYISGESSPSAKSLMKLCETLDVSADYLLGLNTKGK